MHHHRLGRRTFPKHKKRKDRFRYRTNLWGWKNKVYLLKKSWTSVSQRLFCNGKRLLNIYLQTSLASVEDTLSYRFQQIPTYPHGKKSATKPAHCENVKQTQRHVISCCSKELEDGRYTWRHNSVLYALCHHLSVAVNSDDKSYADLIGFQTPTILLGNIDPMLVL